MGLHTHSFTWSRRYDEQRNGTLTQNIIRVLLCDSAYIYMFKDNFIIHWFAFYLSIDDWVLNFNSCSYSKLNIKKIYFRIPDLKCQAQIQKGIGD